MGRNFIPSVSQRKEQRYKDKEPTRKYFIDPSKIENAYVNGFLGQIFFWTFTLRKVSPSSMIRRIRVTTHRYIPKHKLYRLESVFKYGCQVKPVLGYSFRYTFDITLPEPMMMEHIVKIVVKSLEDLL